MSTLPKAVTPVKVFFSYSHEDEDLRKKLHAHLGSLSRLGLMEEWSDHKIGPGTEWKGQIDSKLDSAQVILLLISASFMASRYCYDVEMTRAIERHHLKEARVIPILMRPVEWRGT